jgi:chaperone required for assembly of F1-ATPase
MMAGWTAKRFWKQASAAAMAEGYGVFLDGKGVKTPAKRPLVVPSFALAKALALEWDAQEGVVNPRTMPLTRMANSALDKVAPQFAEVADMLAAYGAHDLLCYRATGPQTLIERQVAGWTPLLEWATQALGASLHVTQGIIPIEQPADSIRALSARVHGFDAFELAAFHDLVTISGSLILALAVTDGRLGLTEAWTLARIDDDWQAEVWGTDDEAIENARLKQSALESAGRFLALCRSQSA